MSSWITATIARWSLCSEGLGTLSVDAPRVDFQPGQFLNLALDVEGERVKRSYSVASAPGAPLEFYLTEVSGGALTPRLFRLGPGEPLLLDTQAQGFFTLQWIPESARELWLLCTGTGLGPFISMCRDPRLLARFSQVVLVHGARFEAQLGYRDELRALADRAPNFRYLSALTRQSAAQSLSGRLPQLIAGGELESAAGLGFDVARSHFMLCGNPDMIRDVSAALADQGMKKHRSRVPGHITTEKYW